MNSFLTESEIGDLQESNLSRKTPFAIRGVSQTQFSIARHYGGINYQGQPYTYVPETDELIRDDVLKWVVNRRKAAKKKPNGVDKRDLFEGEK